MGAARWILALGAAVATLASSEAAARAQEQLAPSDPAGSHSSWYGWQILFTDAAAVSFVGVGASASDGSSLAVQLALVSGLVYLGGGPLVHGLHDRGTAAGESFFLRLGLPSVMALVGGVGAWALSGGCGAHGCTLSPAIGAGGGALFGVAAASVIDIAVLAHEPRPAPRESTAATLTLRPVPLVLREAGYPPASGFGIFGLF